MAGVFAETVWQGIPWAVLEVEKFPCDEVEYMQKSLVNMKKLAALFGVPVTELLDDFNKFLYYDQGKQIREKRMSLNMTQREYADKLGVSLCNLKKWEMNRVRIFKSTWERYFR